MTDLADVQQRVEYAEEAFDVVEFGRFGCEVAYAFVEQPGGGGEEFFKEFGVETVCNNKNIGR